MAKTLYNYYKEPKSDTPSINQSSTYVIRLRAEDFVIDTPGVSFKIIDALGFQLAHYLLGSITSWDLKGDQIIINTSDEISIVYNFFTEFDASIVNEKLNNFINGV